MKKIHVLALIPVFCLVVGPVFANSVTPYILGMPIFIILDIIISPYYISLYGDCVRI